MSRLELIKHGLRLWKVPHVPRETNRANFRKWLKSVERLGERWLFHRSRTCDELKAQRPQ